MTSVAPIVIMMNALHCAAPCMSGGPTTVRAVPAAFTASPISS
jgi:hypothetical protein